MQANRGHEHDLAVDQDKPAAQQLQDGPGAPCSRLVA